MRRLSFERPFLRPPLLLLPLCVALVVGGAGCSDPGPAADPLVDDAAALAALADGDGEDLGTALAALDFDAAVEEDVDAALLDGEGMARECRFVDYRRRIVEEYDVDGDGGLDRDERRALRDDLAVRPFRLRLHARHFTRLRLHWIYDADDSGHLDGAERDELRGDLELRCLSREAWLLERYDENGDGVLDDDEWSAAVADLAERRQAIREAFIDRYDVNDDGWLDFFERIQAYVDRLQRILDRHEAALDQYDLDGDGRLSTEEREALRERLKARVRGEHLGHDGDCEVEPCEGGDAGADLD